MQNLIEEPEKCGSDKDSDFEVDEKKPRKIIRSATDLMRLKVEKLMKNPEKPIIIPEQPKEKDYMQTVPTFVRNVMGSSAGAGSGEFHVYRHLRRKEYARQKSIHAKSIREQLDEEYSQKLENNRLASETKTAKKRAKRLKKKERSKMRKTQGGPQNNLDKTEVLNESESVEEESDKEENSSTEVAEHEQTVNVSQTEPSKDEAMNDEGSNKNEESRVQEEENAKKLRDEIQSTENPINKSSTSLINSEKSVVDTQENQPKNAESHSQDTNNKSKEESSNSLVITENTEHELKTEI